MRTILHFRAVDITGVALHGGINGAQHILQPEKQRLDQQCCGWTIPSLSQPFPPALHPTSPAQTPLQLKGKGKRYLRDSEQGV